MLRVSCILWVAILWFPGKGMAQQLTAASRIDLSQPVVLMSPLLKWSGQEMATGHYGFFCRQELKADKKLPLPVRFRLGSMQLTDWLERKPNAQQPDH